MQRVRRGQQPHGGNRDPLSARDDYIKIRIGFLYPMEAPRDLEGSAAALPLLNRFASLMKITMYEFIAAGGKSCTN